MAKRRKRGTVKEMVEAIESAEGEAPDLIPPIHGSQGDGPPLTAKMIRIVQILQSNLLLCEPTLNWLERKQSELAAAQLAVLFSPEELAAKRKLLEGEQ